MDTVTWVANSRLRETNSQGYEEVTIHTDGLLLASAYDPGWPCALRLLPNKKYRVTVTVEEVAD